MNQDSIQDSTRDGGGNTSSTTGFATGTVCPSSGTYRSDGKYMDIIAAVAAGQIFGPDATGKKTTWVALSTSTSTNKDGSFTSVKVLPGTA